MKSVEWHEAVRIATAVEAPSAFGIHRRFTKALGSCDWPSSVTGGVGCEFGENGIIWLEPDTFNSKAFSTPIARLHQRLKTVPTNFAATVDALDDSELVCTRLIGQPRDALAAFQREGWRITATNLVFYRLSSFCGPDLPMPAGFEVRIRALHEEPFSLSEINRLLAMANEAYFPDRFSLDPRINPVAARNRFSRVIHSALKGALVSHIIVSTFDGEPASFQFFDIDRKAGMAGRWLTAFVNPQHQARHLGRGVFMRAVNAPVFKGLNWTWSAYLGNLASVEAYHLLGFRIAHFTHDLHRWRTR